MIFRLVYFAENNLPDARLNGAKELKAILDTSRRNNNARAITGTLAYDGTHFAGVLEGERNKVNEIYSRICNDDRQTQICTCLAGSIEERMFKYWTFFFSRRSSATNSIIQRYHESGLFEPEKISGDSLLQILYQLKKHALASEQPRQQTASSSDRVPEPRVQEPRVPEPRMHGQKMSEPNVNSSRMHALKMDESKMNGPKMNGSRMSAPKIPTASLDKSQRMQESKN